MQGGSSEADPPFHIAGAGAGVVPVKADAGACGIKQSEPDATGIVAQQVSLHQRVPGSDPEMDGVLGEAVLAPEPFDSCSSTPGRRGRGYSLAYPYIRKYFFILSRPDPQLSLSEIHPVTCDRVDWGDPG
jgi:hypothetical protein